MNYPKWIIDEVKTKKSAIKTELASQVKSDLSSYSHNTICYEAKCPNKGECFNSKHATFLILGDTCTRACKFCSVKKGKPKPLDKNEPLRIAETVKKWNLKYVVFTSPTRDDLEDGGAEQFVNVINAIRNTMPQALTEPLIPDFSLNIKAVEKVLSASPTVLAHNIETVERLYSSIRPKASYQGSLNLLQQAKRINPKIPTKSSIIIGMGETTDEIKKTIEDLKKSCCDILVIAQYLMPTPHNHPVIKYYTPDEFEKLKEFALKVGFKAVLAKPLARSSYKAYEMYLEIKKQTL